MAWRVFSTSLSIGVPAIGKKRIKCSGGGNGVMPAMRSSSVRLVRSSWLYTRSGRALAFMVRFR